jgi:hypothetical protein
VDAAMLAENWSEPAVGTANDDALTAMYLR